MLDGFIGRHETETPLLLLSLDFLPFPCCASSNPPEERGTARSCLLWLILSGKHTEDPGFFAVSTWIPVPQPEELCVQTPSGTWGLPGTLRSRHCKDNCCSDGI